MLSTGSFPEFKSSWRFLTALIETDVGSIRETRFTHVSQTSHELAHAIHSRVGSHIG